MVDNIGERIRKRRLELGIKQDDLAVMIGTSQGHLSDIENGKSSNPGIDTIQRICNALKLNDLLNDIFDINIHKEPDPQLQTLIEKYYQMSPRSRKSLLSFADQMLLIDEENAAAKEAK